ncbi:hypothetical protein RRF57_012663 [Xylaria bambusicola]|uniref:Uncharacterized protein n=1 Tax=Xylaria bambusicola TaxID=326684 RepID=A0AAN7ZDU2_9PEZI
MAKPATPQAPSRQPPASRIPPPSRPRVDISSAAYKQAASRYTRVMIAMPILLVTSYYLFDRLALGHEAKTLHGAPNTDGMNKE